MDNNIVGAVAVFLLGAAISFINYKLTELIMKKYPGRFSFLSIVRSLIQAGFFLLVFAAAPYTPWDRTYLLVGTALGITIPMAFFTFRLLKKPYPTDIKKEEKEDISDG